MNAPPRPRFRRAAAFALALMLVTGAAACGGDDDDASDAGDTTTSVDAESSSTIGEGPVSTLGDPNAGKALTLGKAGLGPLRLGMTLEEATATGLVGEFTPGCEVASPRPDQALLVAPLEGYVAATDGIVDEISVRAGAVSDPAGVAIGQGQDAAQAAFEAAGLTVEVRTDMEEIFGFRVLSASDADGLVLEALVSTDGSIVDALVVGGFSVCD